MEPPGEVTETAVSMHDVARLAGVSQRTVSNVINGYVHVSAETRARVQRAVETLNYRPNISAQKLRNGKTGIVALAMPEIAQPYFSELADHFQRYAASKGITLLIDQTGGTRHRELLVLDGYRSNIIDGLILNPLNITVDDLAHRPLDVPVVLLGESIDQSGFLHVSIDNIAAAEIVTEHLIATGRRRIVALGSHLTPGDVGPDKRRLQGYVQALTRAGINPDPALMFDTQVWSRAEGYAGAARIAELRRSEGPQSVDALFCFNDVLALGALKAFHDYGVRVPRDVAVVGWDDIEQASYAVPALTSIAPDKALIVQQAVDGVLVRRGSGRVKAEELTCPFTLRVRASTARADS